INVLIALAAFAILVVELYPIFITLINGFRKDIVILSGRPFEFSQLTLRSYELAFRNPGFVLGLRNSIVVGLLATAISVAVGAMASYGISRYRFRGRNILAYSFLVFRMLPQISLVIALYLMFKSLGIRDTVFGLTLAHTSFNVPFVIWLLLPFFTAVDKSYEEAAMVDGCTRFGVFRRVFLPIVSPGLVVGAVFAFINSWNEFLYALILTGINARTAPVSINSLIGSDILTWGQVCAGGTILLLPIFIFTVSMQRFLIRGVSAGGVKG
ncbi:MAG: carbohydrate ABC transporter permease, partial [Rectinemataceae bacterium]